MFVGGPPPEESSSLLTIVVAVVVVVVVVAAIIVVVVFFCRRRRHSRFVKIIENSSLFLCVKWSVLSSFIFAPMADRNLLQSLCTAYNFGHVDFLTLTFDL